MWGLLAPGQDKLLPFRSSPVGIAPAEDGTTLPEEPTPPSSATYTSEDIVLDGDVSLSEGDAPTLDAPDVAPVVWRLKLAERRLQDGLTALEAASLWGAPPWIVRRWEEAYMGEVQTYEAAYTAWEATSRRDVGDQITKSHVSSSGHSGCRELA